MAVAWSGYQRCTVWCHKLCTASWGWGTHPSPCPRKSPEETQFAKCKVCNIQVCRKCSVQLLQFEHCPRPADADPGLIIEMPTRRSKRLSGSLRHAVWAHFWLVPALSVVRAPCSLRFLRFRIAEATAYRELTQRMQTKRARDREMFSERERERERDRHTNGGATPDEIPTPDTLPWQPPPHQPHTTEHAQHPPHPPSQHHHTGPGGQGGQEEPTEEFTSPRSEPEEGRPDTLGGLQRRGSPLPDHDSRRRRTHEGASSD